MNKFASEMGKWAAGSLFSGGQPPMESFSGLHAPALVRPTIQLPLSKTTAPAAPASSALPAQKQPGFLQRNPQIISSVGSALMGNPVAMGQLAGQAVQGAGGMKRRVGEWLQTGGDRIAQVGDAWAGRAPAAPPQRLSPPTPKLVAPEFQTEEAPPPPRSAWREPASFSPQVRSLINSTHVIAPVGPWADPQFKPSPEKDYLRQEQGYMPPSDAQF